LLQISKKNGQYSVLDLGIVKDAASNGKNSFTAMETGFGMAFTVPVHFCNDFKINDLFWN